jgi:hypothetical protein
MGKEDLPQIVYTTEEWKQLKEYAHSRDIAVKDDRAAARLQSTRIMAGVELRDAHAKGEAFETSRHFWKFDVEGWGKMSLREAEARIKQHTRGEVQALQLSQAEQERVNSANRRLLPGCEEGHTRAARHHRP